MNSHTPLKSQMTIDCLIACSGLHILVDSIQINEGTAMECEKYFENSEKSHIDMIHSMDSRISEQSFQALSDESIRNHEIRLQIIKVIEGVMPYCLNADRQSVDAIIDRIFNLAGKTRREQSDLLSKNIDCLQLNTDTNTNTNTNTNKSTHDMITDEINHQLNDSENEKHDSCIGCDNVVSFF